MPETVFFIDTVVKTSDLTRFASLHFVVKFIKILNYSADHLKVRGLVT
jgi:hypothetical protein